MNHTPGPDILICVSQDLSSFGFRGEALSSLCAVAEVVVSTRTEDNATGTRISYDKNGIIQSKSPVARAKGTTVAAKQLFKPLPVRFKVGHNIHQGFLPVFLVHFSEPELACTLSACLIVGVKATS